MIKHVQKSNTGEMRVAKAAVLCFSLFLAGASFAGRSYYLYEMAEGETFDLALDNVTNTFYNASGAARGHLFVANSNCTVRLLPKANPGGVATIYASFLADKGDLTLDLSALSDYSEVWFRGSVRSDGLKNETIGEKTGRIHIVGRDRLIVGTATRGDETSINYPFLHTDFVFDSPDAPGIVLTNDVSLMSLPATCATTVADGARVALIGSNLPGLGVSETLALTNHDVYLVRKASLPTNTTVAVPAGRELHYRPIGMQNWFEWGGEGNNTYDFNVDLQDPTARFVMINNSNGNNIRGTVSGTGSVEMFGTGETYFLKDVTLNGIVSWKTTGKLIFRAKAGGENATFAMDTAECKAYFQPDGYGTRPASASIGALSGVATNCLLHVYNRGTLNIGSASGSFGIASEGGVSKVVIGSLAAGAVVHLPAGVELVIGSIGEGAKVHLAPNGARKAWTVTGPADGERQPLILVPLVEGGTLTVGGRLDVGALEGFAEVDVAEGSEVMLNVSAGTRIGGRGAHIAMGKATDSWKSKVALWVDAAATNTFQYVSDVWGDDLTPAPVVTTGGKTYRQLLGWKDVRSSQRTYQFRNVRFTTANSWKSAGDAAATVCPYVVPEGIGTNAYVSMLSNNRHLRLTEYGTTTKRNLKTAYAIVVFGSQGGGGGALFASTNSVFDRALNPKTEINKPASATAYTITTNSFDAFVDGVATNTSQATFNGGWQIISLDTRGEAVSGIGYMREDGSGAPPGRGYTQYAEIILFSEAPTAEERRAVEEYLAEKWQIDLGGTPISHRLVLSGSGELSISQDVTVEGLFSGTVNLNGHKLTLPAGRVPFTESEIPAGGRTIWADPSIAGAVNLSTNPATPLEVERIFLRDNDGLRNLDGAQTLISPIKEDGTLDRRPIISAGARAVGSAATWIDFTDLYGDGSGNTMCLRTLPTDPPERIDSSGNITRVVRTGFCVLDSSSGGGTPLSDRLNVNNVIAARPCGDPDGWDSPIWAAASSNYVREAATYLDGVQVDGSISGFSGRPELLSFQFDRQIEIKCFGYYGHDTAARPNREMLGEILLYNTALDDETRERIEAYLMKKWLGRTPEGFVDFRGLEVTGAGEVEVPSLDALPRFGAAFAGTVSVTGPLAFSIDASGNVVNAVAVTDATFNLPNPCAVTLTLDSAAACGTYTLMSCAGFQAGQTFELASVTGRENVTVHLVSSGGTLRAEVLPKGTLVIVR